VSFGGHYQPQLTPTIRMYNAYFGGGMSSIIFQEMREARALAYQAGSGYNSPSRLEELYTSADIILCDVDKMKDAMEAFDTLKSNMPENEESFKIAKESTLSNYQTARTRKEKVVWTYLNWKRLGLNEDPRPAVYAAIPNVTLENIKQFQKENVTDKPQTIVILGDVNKIDMEYLKKLGKVKVLSLKDIFGY